MVHLRRGYLFIVDLNPTVIVSIKRAERVSQCLDIHTSLDKVVKRHIPLPTYNNKE